MKTETRRQRKRRAKVIPTCRQLSIPSTLSCPNFKPHFHSPEMLCSLCVRFSAVRIAPNFRLNYLLGNRAVSPLLQVKPTKVFGKAFNDNHITWHLCNSWARGGRTKCDAVVVWVLVIKCKPMGVIGPAQERPNRVWNISDPFLL